MITFEGEIFIMKYLLAIGLIFSAVNINAATVAVTAKTNTEVKSPALLGEPLVTSVSKANSQKIFNRVSLKKTQFQFRSDGSILDSEPVDGTVWGQCMHAQSGGAWMTVGSNQWNACCAMCHWLLL